MAQLGFEQSAGLGDPERLDRLETRVCEGIQGHRPAEAGQLVAHTPQLHRDHDTARSIGTQERDAAESSTASTTRAARAPSEKVGKPSG